MDFILT
jgi:hypothetical protein